jgi:hypothetical protein
MYAYPSKKQLQRAFWQAIRLQRGDLLGGEGRLEEVWRFLVATEQVNDEVQPLG